VELRLGRRALAVSALAATLTAAAGAAGFLLTRAQERDGASEEFLRVALPTITEFEGAVHAAADGVTRPGTSGPATDAAAARAGLEAIVVVTPQPGGSAGAAITAAANRGVPIVSPDDIHAGLEATFDIARDRAQVRATPAIATVGRAGPITMIVAPRYRADAPTGTTAERRAALESFSVGVLRPAAAADLLGPLVAMGGGVEVRDGEMALVRTGERGGGEAVRVRFLMAGRTWSVTAHPPATSTGTLPFVVLGSGLALALLVMASARHSFAAEQRAAAEAFGREEDLRAAAVMGPLLQESLDLSDVLPAASSFLADHFELEGVSIAYTDDHGELVEAFTLGHRVDGVPRRSVDLRSPPAELRAGEVAAVPLLRGGRVIGAVHALARTDLSPQRTRTLVSVAERIGTAVANARQFERERESVRRLTELDRLQNEFLGTVSHELQTPITAILGFSSMLDEQYEDLTPDERRDFVARVARNATSLSSLVRELLDFSRLGRGQFALNPHEIDLSDLVARIVDQFSGLVERHRIVFDAPAGIWALADSDAVERVLSNLLSNAAKYSPPGSAILVSLAHQDDEATITVDDAGPGVAEADRPHVFHRFYRGSSPAAVSTRGAGIGLAVVQDLVERMEGHVSVGAAPTGGARFTVVLPMHKRGPASPQPPSEPAGQGRVP
jgi:signal transduction histidine kinase